MVNQHAVATAVNPAASDASKTSNTGSLMGLPFTKVVVHPLVLLSVVDHYTRMTKVGNRNRVVGILLGSIKGKGILDISNSFAGKFTVLFT